ncbi:MAG TPA: hypothetical protein VMW27_20925, partial [Thermoanaerobaculia bacterium]|nr:hypothetical protein [Thermoanaerobaculia bacterium]
LPQALYAGSNGQGVFRSDDGGGTWLWISSGLTNLNVQALAVDPTDSRTVYAGTANGLFKTTDSGASWTLSDQGITSAPYGGIRELAVDPEHPTTVFAASLTEVFRSTDGGETWQRVFMTPVGLEIQALAAGPGSKVYLGAWSPHFSDKLFWASRDGGETWEAPATMAGGVFGLQVDPENGDSVYAAIGSVLGRSLDGGTTWSYKQVPLGTTSVAVDPGDPEAVYTGSDFQGVWFQDGTASGPLGSGLVSPYVVALATDPLSPGTVYVAVRGGGVFRLDRR